MKIVRLSFFVYFLCCFNPLFAQEEEGNGLLFPEFEKGEVIFKNGRRTSALLNYNIITQEMLFMDNDNTILMLANPTETLVVIIDGRRFFPVSSGGIFYEEIQVEGGSFFVQHKANMLSEGKKTGYGGYSQTSSITSIGSLYGDNSGVYNLKVDEKFRLKNSSFYYILSGKNYKRFSSAKSLGKLFKGNESKIEEFAKEHSIDFTKIEDIARIVEYGYSLSNK